jgi:hypothetical protein
MKYSVRQLILEVCFFDKAQDGLKMLGARCCSRFKRIWN